MVVGFYVFPAGRMRQEVPLTPILDDHGSQRALNDELLEEVLHTKLHLSRD